MAARRVGSYRPGGGTAGGEQLAYNSVLTTIRILEQKGYVEHRQEGRAFVYWPCIPENEASRSEVRNMLNRFFGNSREQLVLSLLGDEEISSRGVARLREAIRSAAPDKENERREGREISMPSVHMGNAILAGRGYCKAAAPAVRRGPVAGRSGCRCLGSLPALRAQRFCSAPFRRVGCSIRGRDRLAFLTLAAPLRRCWRHVSARGSCGKAMDSIGQPVGIRHCGAVAVRLQLCAPPISPSTRCGCAGYGRVHTPVAM